MGKSILIILFFVFIVALLIYFIGRLPEILPPFKFAPISTRQPYSPSYYSYATPQIGAISSTTIPDYLIPSGFTRDQLSPYFQKLKISAYGSFFGSGSQIRIYSTLSGKETANITGWRIKSNKGEIIIPQAVNVYEPSGFASPDGIILSGYNTLVIYSGTSPIGLNLRLNKCIGYLQNTNNFNPSLPLNCPYISRSEISYLYGGCQNYILSLGGCKLPDASFYNILPGNADGDNCRRFLDTLNYYSCFQKHRSDSDFISNEWWAWINQNNLDPLHDDIRLFDNNSKLVDEYIY